MNTVNLSEDQSQKKNGSFSDYFTHEIKDVYSQNLIPAAENLGFKTLKVEWGS